MPKKSPEKPERSASITIYETPRGTPKWRGFWRDSTGKLIGRTLGSAWVTVEGGTWKRKRGKPPEGWVDERAAWDRLADLMAEHEAGLKAGARNTGRHLFQDLVPEWLDWLERTGKARESTLVSMRRTFAHPSDRHAGKTMIAFGDRPVHEIDTAAIKLFLDRLAQEKTPRGRPPSNRTLNRRRAELHGFFRYLIEERHILTENPVTDVPKLPEGGEQDIDTFTDEELSLIEKHAIGDDKVLFLFAAQTGLRVGELRALRWRRVDIRKKRVAIPRAISHHEEDRTKGSKVRYVPLTDDAIKGLKRLRGRGYSLGANDLVFPDRNGKTQGPTAMSSRFFKTLERAGIRHRRFHDLRHTFGSRAVEVFTPVEVKEMMGHASLQTTERYLHARSRHDDSERLQSVFNGTGSDSFASASTQESGCVNSGEDDQS